MRILTIVIPSYNTEAFIDKNMQYFLDDRLFEDVEILIINDGSKDRTSEFASKYEKEYKGYIRLIDKENGGHGSVINRGIREAEGEYFKVIDADDWVDADNLVCLVDFLKQLYSNYGSEGEADVIVNPYYKIFEDSGKRIKIYTCQNVNYGTVYMLDDIIQSKLGALALHGCTFRTKILKNITVTENCYYDDYQYVNYPVPFLKTIAFFEKPVYYYLVGQENQSVSDKNVLKNVDMMMKILEDSVAFFQSEGIPASRKGYIDTSIAGFGKSIYNVFLRNYKNLDSFAKIMQYDDKLKTISAYYYVLIGEQYAYIKLLRKGNKLVFRTLGRVFRFYKKIKKQ